MLGTSGFSGSGTELLQNPHFSNLVLIVCSIINATLHKNCRGIISWLVWVSIQSIPRPANTPFHTTGVADVSSSCPMQSEQDDHIPPPQTPVTSTPGVDGFIETRLQIISEEKIVSILMQSDSDALGPDELATMFPPLEGYELKVNEQQLPHILGAGGFGEVYLATECRLNRPVAIKILRAEFAADRHQVAQFFLEEASTSQLQHPGIPPVHAMGLWKGCPQLS